MRTEEIQEYLFRHLPEGSDYTFQFWNDMEGWHFPVGFEEIPSLWLTTKEKAVEGLRNRLGIYYNKGRIVKISRYMVNDKILVFQIVREIKHI